MWVSVWTVLVAIATLATGTWVVLERRIPMMTSISAFAWGLLAFRGGELTTFDGGTEFTTTLVELQYFAAFMTVLSVLGLILWLLGDFPPEDNNTPGEAV